MKIVERLRETRRIGQFSNDVTVFGLPWKFHVNLLSGKLEILQLRRSLSSQCCTKKSWYSWLNFNTTITQLYEILVDDNFLYLYTIFIFIKILTKWIEIFLKFLIKYLKKKLINKTEDPSTKN